MTAPVDLGIVVAFSWWSGSLGSCEVGQRRECVWAAYRWWAWASRGRSWYLLGFVFVWVILTSLGFRAGPYLCELIPVA